METIVILHGWQSSKEKWHKVHRGLKSSLEGVEVIVPDIPGFKAETELKTPWDLNNYLEWFNKFLAENHIEDSFFLIGHSFGGRISIKFAEKYPERLKGLILISAAGIKNKSFRKNILGSGAQLIRKLHIEDAPLLGSIWQIFRKFFYIYILRKTDYLKTSGALRQTIKNVLDEDLTPLLNRIFVPASIIWGEKDKLTPLKDGLLMHKQIKNSRLEVLKGIGHTPYLENPELLVKKIIGLFRDVGAYGNRPLK